jgi:hypothetical protein
MGEAGLRTLLKNHDPETYVRSILDMAAHARQFRVRKTALDVAKRAGTKMGSWSSHDPEKVAAKIYDLFSPR